MPRALKPNRYLSNPTVARQYQIDAVLRLIKTPRMILGDDVGLGKTVESLLAFTYLKARDPSLKCIVFTEVSTVHQWVEEAERFTDGLDVVGLTAGGTAPRDRKLILEQFDHDIIVTSYSLMHRHDKHLHHGLYGKKFILIADEPTAFKNHTTKLHARMLRLGQAAIFCWGLTATPVENSLTELWGMYRVIAPGLFPTKKFFEERWCIMKQVRYRPWPIIVGFKNLGSFRKHIEPHYFGRLQTDPSVDQELPEVIFKDVVVDLDSKASGLLMAAEQNVDANSTVMEGVTALVYQQDLCNDPNLKLDDWDGDTPKLDAVRELLNGSLRGQKVAIFCKRRKLIDRLEELLNTDKHNVVRITGSDDACNRNWARKTFHESDEPVIMLLTKAGGRGLNLQAGGHLIFFDLPWSYGLYRQLMGRLKRVGSLHRRIGVYHFLARKVDGSKTIDHHVLATIKRKKKLFDVVTGDDESIDTSESDIREIIDEIVAQRKAA